MSEAAQQILDELAAKKHQQIEMMGLAVAKLRDQAVEKRRESGIETQWQEDEEYYQGVDDANRSNGTYTKSTSTEGGLIGDGRKKKTNRTTAFFNLTRQFCDSASARVSDIICPSGDWNFQLKATPVPDIEEYAEDKTPVQDTEGQPVLKEDGQPAVIGEFAKEELDKSAKSAKKAEKYILDWLVECNYHTQVRRVIDDCIKLGAGILKGPIPEEKKKRRVTREGDSVTVEIEAKVSPVSKRISVWNFYPDGDCGESIHSGSCCFEKDYLTRKQLEALKGVEGYLAIQIDKVIEEGPGKCNIERQRDSRGRYKKGEKTSMFEVWYFYGEIPSEDLDACYEIGGGDDPRNDGERKKKSIPAIVTLVNDSPIKAVVSHLASGEFPYDLITWQQIDGKPWGIGVARQGRTAQEFYCASARTLVDNAGVSGAPMCVVNRSVVQPADGRWEIGARKVWYTAAEALQADVRTAFMFVDIPSRQQELTALIQLAKQMMEESTGIFFLMQGDQGAAPDTVGGMQLLHNNSSAVLRRFARVFDEMITEPHISRYYYDRLMVDPDIPSDCKIDMTIDAIGSAVLVERAIQEMQVTNLAVMALNPAYGWDPEKAGEQLLKSLRFDPEGFKMDPEKKEQVQQPEDPRIAAAKIREEGANARAREQNEIMQAKIAADTDRDTSYNNSLANRDMVQAQTKREELQMKLELARLEYAEKHNISLEELKTELATTAMKLRTQKELSRLKMPGKQATSPPTEPAGKAPIGESFQK